jgi:glyoxylase I family protein
MNIFKKGPSMDKQEQTKGTSSGIRAAGPDTPRIVSGVWGVRYQVRNRNQMEVGPGGKQIQLEDPDGNPIELFEPAG